MITAEQLLNCQFTKSGMNGYKGTEVDEIISQAAEALGYYEKKIRDMQLSIDELKKNDTIIQTTLVNAQRLADQITAEAQQKADAVLAAAQEQADALAKESEAQAGEKTAAAEKTAREMMDGAKSQATALLEKAKRANDELTRAAGESKAEQEALLAAMKNEVAAFRAKLLAQYKEHLELIERLPSEIRELTLRVAKEEPAPEIEEEVEQESKEDAGARLQELADDMKENEAAAAQAVDEVAGLTADEPEEAAEPLPTEEPEQSQAAEEEETPAEEPVPAAPAPREPKAHRGGFSVILDDDED